jgi:hypothetical protein
MEWIIGAIMIAVVLYPIWQGYRQESSPRPPSIELQDDGHGIMEPVCPHCRTKLVSITRQTESWIAAILALLFGLVGVVLLLFNWIAGGVTLILAIIINMVGKGKQTALTCPVCGKDARILD